MSPNSPFTWDSSRISLDTIKAAVCAHFNLPQETMTSRDRRYPVVRPRQIGMYLARHLAGLSYYRIGKRFGWRDHTTARDAVLKIEQMRAQNEAIDADVRAIEARLVAAPTQSTEGERNG